MCNTLRWGSLPHTLGVVAMLLRARWAFWLIFGTARSGSAAVRRWRCAVRHRPVAPAEPPGRRSNLARRGPAMRLVSGSAVPPAA